MFADGFVIDVKPNGEDHLALVRSLEEPTEFSLGPVPGKEGGGDNDYPVTRTGEARIDRTADAIAYLQDEIVEPDAEFTGLKCLCERPRNSLLVRGSVGNKDVPVQRAPAGRGLTLSSALEAAGVYTGWAGVGIVSRRLGLAPVPVHRRGLLRSPSAPPA